MNCIKSGKCSSFKILNDDNFIHFIPIQPNPLHSKTTLKNSFKYVPNKTLCVNKEMVNDSVGFCKTRWTWLYSSVVCVPTR